MGKSRINHDEEARSKDFWQQMSKLLQDPETRRQIIETLFNESVIEENKKRKINNGLRR